MSGENVDGIDVAGNYLERAHADDLRAMLANMLAQLMNAEVSQLCGANYGERNEDSTNQRNGYRERPLETRLGSISLQIPRLRSGSYMPSFLEPRRRWEKAFVNVVAEAYVKGVSTRKVEELVEAMGAKGMSKSEVSPGLGLGMRPRLQCAGPPGNSPTTRSQGFGAEEVAVQAGEPGPDAGEGGNDWVVPPEQVSILVGCVSKP